MIEFSKGIYALDAHTPSRKEQIAVAIHPFHLRKPPLRYLKNLQNFLLSYNGPLLTIEEYGKTEATSQTYQEMGRNTSAFFVEFGAYVTDEELKIAKKFIKRFKHDPLQLIGGRYTKHGGGCLGDAARIFAAEGFNVKVLFEITFN